jgi:hypothetical protein
MHWATQAFAALLLTVALTTGCGGGARDPNAPSRPLPAYAGRSVELFDDTIEPAAVGLDFDRGYQPRTDPLFRERAQLSDAVLRVKVQTVTARREGGEATYQLGLLTLEKLGGPHPPSERFDVTIRKGSESHGIMRSFESRLVNREFVAFVRDFVRPDGDREIHFHLAPSTKAVTTAVTDALLTGPLK